MRSYYSKPNNKKLIVYAVIAAIVVGIGAVVMQDITIPTERVSQEIKVDIKK